MRPRDFASVDAAGRLEKLQDFLKAVTPATASRLAQAVEFDRLRGGALPHEKIMDALRPHLRAAGNAERVMTVERMVGVCFEDMLVDTRLRKQRGRIARSSIAPVFRWLENALGDAGKAALDAIAAKVVSAGPDFAKPEIAAFHAQASAAILAAVPDPTGDGPAAGAIGADAAADAHDMARAMQIASQIGELQRILPRPIAALGEDDIFAVRGVWERVIAETPDCAPYVVFGVLGRLAKPWEIMRLAGALSRKMDDILISRTDVGHVGELLLSDLEGCVERLAAIRADQLTAAAVLGPIETFGTVSTGIVRELGIKRDGLWGKRLMAARGGMSGQVERLLARASRDIAVTLPMKRAPGFSLRPRRMPDMTKRLDPPKAARAIEIATVIAGARPHALAGAFAGLLAEIDETTGDLLRRYGEEMLDELLAVDDALRPQASAFAAHATALTALLLGPEEAGLLQRRAASAIAAHQGEALRA